MSIIRTFKERLHAGEYMIGSWIDSTDSTITEAMCGAGFDFLIIDAEHGPHDLNTIMLHVIATKGTNTIPIVRVAWNDPVIIKRVLDIGASGVIVPMVKNAEEARQAVSACLYPPDGIRGFGPRRSSNYGRFNKEYIKKANDDLIIIMQIEHIEAVRNIAGIVRVPRVDGVIVGSNDLSASIGLLGNPEHHDVIRAIETVIKAAREVNLPMGIAGSIDPEKICMWINRGVTFLTMGSDTAFLVSAADSSLIQAKKLLQK